MKANINKLSLLLVLLFWGCSTSKTGSNSGINKLDESTNVTAKTLSNYISSIPRLIVRGSGSNLQVYNASVSTIQKDNRPLFVLNGVQVGRDYSRVLSMLRENQNVEVDFLKISRATIRYGESGRNGVILIDAI